MILALVRTAVWISSAKGSLHWAAPVQDALGSDGRCVIGQRVVEQDDFARLLLFVLNPLERVEILRLDRSSVVNVIRLVMACCQMCLV